MPFPVNLQNRSANFLQRPIPAELLPNYVSGSLAEIVITQCARAEPLDSELCEIAEISAIEYDSAIAEAKTTELKAYFSECQQLLREIVQASR